MTTVWTLAALWFGLALFASLCSSYLRVSTALAEIIVGTAAAWILSIVLGANVLGADEPWIKFLSGAGAIMLTDSTALPIFATDHNGVFAKVEFESPPGLPPV